MATLSQTLNPLKRSQDGGLEKAPDLKQAMANVGATQAPTMPIGGTLIGANPDAVKMVGTSAQLNAAQSRQQDQAAPVDSLQTAVRQQQSRTATTTAEQGKMQKSADMQALGGLGDRVTNFIDTQRAKLTTAKATMHAEVGAGGVATQSAADALTALARDPSNMKLQKAANLALGRTPEQSTTITAAEIPGLYASAVSSISKSGAEAVDNSLNISTLISDPAFGYDANSLSNLLGLPADQISAMTVKQLTDAVNNTIATEFSASAANQQVATSGIAGQAERAMAQSAGRELSSTGIRATEADQANLESQIANADQVLFGGQTYQIEDLLNDETISNKITEYMNASEGSPTRDTLERSEPQLIEFINKNDQVLKDAALTLAHGADTFQAIQDQVKSLGQQGGVPVDTKLMRTLIEGYGKDYKTHNVDPSSVPFLANLTGKTDLEKQVAVTGVNTALANKRITPAEVSALSPAELTGLDMTNPHGNFATYISNKNAAAEFAGIPATDTDTQLQRMTTGKLTLDDIKTGISIGKARTTLGIGTNMDTGFLDVNDLAASYARFNTPGSLADAAKGVTAPKQINLANPSRLDGILGSLDKKLGQSAVDGDVSDADMAAAGLDIDELITLEDNRSKPGAKIGEGVTGLRKVAATEYTNEVLGPSIQGTPSVLDSVQGVLAGNPRKIDRNVIKAESTRALLSKVADFYTFRVNYQPNDDLRGKIDSDLDALTNMGMADNPEVKAAIERGKASFTDQSAKWWEQQKKDEALAKANAEITRKAVQVREAHEKSVQIAKDQADAAAARLSNALPKATEGANKAVGRATGAIHKGFKGR